MEFGCGPEACLLAGWLAVSLTGCVAAPRYWKNTAPPPALHQYMSRGFSTGGAAVHTT